MTTGPALIVESQTLPIHRILSVLGRRDRESGFVPELEVGDLDPGRSVSRRHAELTVRDGQVYVLDLGSANGSSINGVGLAAHKPYSLATETSCPLAICVLSIDNTNPGPTP